MPTVSKSEEVPDSSHKIGSIKSVTTLKLEENMMVSAPHTTYSTSHPSLDSLVGYLLVAKRSLSCVEHVSRANEIVTATRQAFVRQTALYARTEFLRACCTRQLDVLAQLHSQLSNVVAESASELEVIVRNMGSAEARLHSTLDGLRSTTVDSKLRPEAEESKSLLDFVEGTGMQGLLFEGKEHIAEAQKAHQQYSTVVEILGQEILTVQSRLALSMGRDHPATDTNPLPNVLKNLEVTAHEMAENLESLVKHYDLCLNALRHTEGAGAAFSRAQNNDLPADQNAALAHEIETVGETMGSGDREHMLEVLQEDAKQVDDVVADIRESFTAISASQDMVLAHEKRLFAHYSQVLTAGELLEAIGLQLDQYLTQLHLYMIRTDEDRILISDKQRQLDELNHFYAGFLGAYDNLIIEVGRRKDVARRMKRVQEDAMAKLEELYNEDLEERELFRTSQGEFLPMDIWPGLMAASPRYDVSLVEGAGSVPDISASVVQRAIRRVSSKKSK